MEIEQHLHGEAENSEKYDNNSVLYAARISVESLNAPLILTDGAQERQNSCLFSG